MENCCGIYRIDCNGECIYVGQSINLRARRASHLRKLRKNTHYNIYLQRLYNKYGGNFIFNKIEECSPENLTKREMFWIKELNPKCNMQIPSDSTYFTITDELRNKMSIISKSRMTLEMKKKISERTKEAMHRPDVWKNFVNGQNNKTNKVPWNKGLRGTSKQSNSKMVYCEELNMTFRSAYAAGIYLGAKDGKSISRTCLGKRNTYRNMHFKYINE